MLAASLARSGIAGLVVGDLLALLQYRGKAPLRAALGCWSGACRLGNPSVYTKHRCKLRLIRCVDTSDLHVQAGPSGHSVPLMEEPLL